MYRKAVKLKQAVSRSPKEWRTDLAKKATENPALDLCPVMGAVVHSASTDGESDWIGSYKKSFDIDPGIDIPAVDLAAQTYQECLLLSAAADL